ncbi:unnamed protein product [Rhizophagus irregularis]|uniref:Uncharacterized protein n=1 Tax=Rhizophagus irregularis TaxID=588596 RepID=A0A916EDZ0_9GLOM|nr:unnamed protein product [Rhizophagus irregularis]
MHEGQNRELAIVDQSRLICRVKRLNDANHICIGLSNVQCVTWKKRILFMSTNVKVNQRLRLKRLFHSAQVIHQRAATQ